MPGINSLRRGYQTGGTTVSQQLQPDYIEALGKTYADVLPLTIIVSIPDRILKRIALTAYGIAKVKLGNEETEMEETASNGQGNDCSSILDIHCCS